MKPQSRPEIMLVASRHAIARGIAALACAVTFFAIPGTGLAQTWKPDHNVEFISPSGAGGGSDRVVRAVDQAIRNKKLVDVTTSIINKPGAGGDIAWKWLNQNGAGGHHISLMTGNLLTNHITGRSALNYSDLTCIAQLFSEASGVAVRADSPIKNGKDLLEILGKDPSSISIAVGTAFGGSGHIAIALATKSAGGNAKKLKVVVFPAFSQALSAMLGGHVDALLNPHSSLIPQVTAGKIRAIAVSTPERVSGVLADVPTFKELGANVHVEAFRAIIGPKGMPAEQVAYWEGVMQKMTETAEWKQNVERRGWIAKFAGSKDCSEGLKMHYGLMREGLAELGLAKN
jgi:putative tricarboxylic transport membrane protein